MAGASELVRIPWQAQMGEARLVLAGKVGPNPLASNERHQQHADHDAGHKAPQAGTHDAQDRQHNEGENGPHAVIDTRDKQKPQVERGQHDKGAVARKQTQQHAEARGDAHAAFEAEEAGAGVTQHRRRHDKSKHGRRHAERAAEEPNGKKAFQYVARHRQGAAPKSPVYKGV